MCAERILWELFTMVGRVASPQPADGAKARVRLKPAPQTGAPHPARGTPTRSRPGAILASEPSVLPVLGAAPV